MAVCMTVHCDDVSWIVFKYFFCASWHCDFQKWDKWSILYSVEKKKKKKKKNRFLTVYGKKDFCWCELSCDPMTPTPRYRSGTLKTPVILPKVQVAGYTLVWTFMLNVECVFGPEMILFRLLDVAILPISDSLTCRDTKGIPPPEARSGRLLTVLCDNQPKAVRQKIFHDKEFRSVNSVYADWSASAYLKTSNVHDIVITRNTRNTVPSNTSLYHGHNKLRATWTLHWKMEATKFIGNFERGKFISII